MTEHNHIRQYQGSEQNASIFGDGLFLTKYKNHKEV